VCFPEYCLPAALHGLIPLMSSKDKGFSNGKGESCKERLTFSAVYAIFIAVEYKKL
jgi:hypothetical protein